MAQPVYNVLFLCTGDSARSVMAEVLLNTLGDGRFRAYSAGSQPAGKVNPFTLELLKGNGHSIEGLRSKSWDDFAKTESPKMDFVITVCDNAAGEVCPIWPGQPMSAHWGFQDPAALEGSDEEKRRLFRTIYQQIANRLRVFLSLPMASLDRLSLHQKVKDIGKAPSMTLGKRLAAEGIGTALLLAAIIGSGIMGEQLAGGNTAIALLANTVATGAALVSLILTFGPISGAHYNPLVSVAEAFWGRLAWREVPLYAVVQVVGAFAGVAAAHLMFGHELFSASRHVRAGLPQMWSEFVATFGLICVILATVKTRPSVVPFAVAAFITSAYWFTASTSFANPAVTLARAASDTFAGIFVHDVPGFLLGQALGAVAAVVAMKWFLSCPLQNKTS